MYMLRLVIMVFTLLFASRISGKGPFFKPHKDTPHSGSTFGSLVIVFPTKHKGGALVLRHGGGEWTFDSAKMVRTLVNPSVAYIAFYSDVEHEVTPVTSVGIWQLGQNLRHRVIPLLCLLTVLWLLQWPKIGRAHV